MFNYLGLSKEYFDNLIIRFVADREINRKKKNFYKEVFHDISEFDFAEKTRKCKIVFEQVTKYRTIERYVTSNYQKTPVYSDVKTRTKKIQLCIRLLNHELEDLPINKEPLIKEFRHEIVERIKSYDLLPSWYLIDIAKYNQNILDNESERIKTNQIIICNEKIKDLNHSLREEQIKEQPIIKKVAILERKINRNDYKIYRITKRPKSIVYSIITIGIYSLLNSQRRIDSLGKKKVRLDNLLYNELQSLTQIKNNIESIINSIAKQNERITDINNNCDTEKGLHLKWFNEAINTIEPLKDNLTNDNSFIPLKDFSGFSYEKIVGCYVIRNVELNKYYVGQSKDIFKRVTRDHFNGTVPKNIIFAEDYFKSKAQDRNNLFEVKIIPCNTKDELDIVEAENIEYYDSFKNGYNGTSGNK